MPLGAQEEQRDRLPARHERKCGMRTKRMIGADAYLADSEPLLVVGNVHLHHKHVAGDKGLPPLPNTGVTNTSTSRRSVSLCRRATCHDSQ